MDNISIFQKNCKPNDFKDSFGVSQIMLHATFSRYFEQCWAIMWRDFHGKVCWNKKKNKIVTINVSNNFMLYVVYLLGKVEFLDKPKLKIWHGDILASSKQSEAVFSRRKITSFNLQLTALGLLTVIRKTGKKRLNYVYFVNLANMVKADGIALSVNASKFNDSLPLWVFP